VLFPPDDWCGRWYSYGCADVNVATGEKGLQFKDMLGEAICIP
jgi:hypothetical protein